MLPEKIKVFVSSTIKDMPNERVASLNAIKEIGAEPIMSEFTIEAQSKDSVRTCLEKVKESDIYILILGGKYGWQPEDTESITEMEYQTAQSNSIPTLVFNTPYEKEPAQKEFSKKVGATYFWKEVEDAFQLKEAIINSLKQEIQKLGDTYKSKKDKIYSNLLSISFPKKVFIADLNIDRDEVIANSHQTNKWLKKDASWFDVALSAIYQKGYTFSHDWYIHNKKIITFHDISDPQLPLSKICDTGTITPLETSEYYINSADQMNVFKSLLSKCLQTKLHKLGIRWFNKPQMYAFMPQSKNSSDHWVNRKIEWERNKKASRVVVKINYSKKYPDEISSSRHLGFKSKFYFFDNEWFLSIRPDWLITFREFYPSKYGYEKVKYIKRRERNMHVFNHLNFILWYLQPSETMEMFQENQPYSFLRIKGFKEFEAAPQIKDDLWRKMETKARNIDLIDVSGNIELFGHGT